MNIKYDDLTKLFAIEQAKETSYIPCIIKTVRIESEGIVLAKMLILSIPEEEETLIDYAGNKTDVPGYPGEDGIY